MDSLPSEILFLIFQECETLTQASALARISNHSYRVWQICRPTLAWKLASREVIAFDDAVLAARALRWRVALLKDRYSEQALNSQFEAITRKPTWSEVVEVMSLQRVANLLENKLRCCAKWYRNSPEQLLIPGVAERKTCYRRISQLMRADPIVSGEYLETLMSESLKPPVRKFNPDFSSRFHYNAGSGDFRLDGERQRVFEQFLILLASCVLENEREITIPERRILGPYGMQYWPTKQRDALDSFRTLTAIYTY